MSKKSGNACRGNCYEITNPAYCCILPWETLKNIWEINIKPHNCILLAFFTSREAAWSWSCRQRCRSPNMNGDFCFCGHGNLCCRYYSNPEITVHSTYAKIYYFYHLTRPGSLIIVFGTFWDPLTLRTQLLVTE